MDPWKEFCFDFLGSELGDCLCAILQAPDVGISGISSCGKFSCHHVWNHGEVESVILAWKSDSVNSCLGKSLLVLLGTLCIGYPSVLAYRTVCVHLLCICSKDVTANLADDIHHAVIGIYSVCKILRSVVILSVVCIIVLFEFHDPLHHRMGKLELEVLVIFVKICHFLSSYLLCFLYEAIIFGTTSLRSPMME